jgi:precorrin-2 dehydrogenase/sirohydrochlorin ferrochelatase
MYLPLHIDLRGKKVLVIGMGEVGKRRVRKLLEAGASITVIDRRRAWVGRGVKFIRRDLRRGALPSFKEYFLVVVSTNDRKLNAAVARKAKREGCLVNRADSFKNGDVIFPAVVEWGRGVFSFTTLGRNPRLSKEIKEALERGLSKG